MMFLDYDGVLGNTIEGLFDEYYILKQERQDLTMIRYIQEKDWHDWLRRAGPQKGSFKVLKKHSPNIATILTRVWSIDEAREKIIYIRENDIRNPIIIVPGDMKKSSMVNPRGHLLVEDQVDNVVDWIKKHGSALLFDGEPSCPFCPTIHYLDEAFDYAYEHGFI